jgi:prevent-host-death family protein
MERTISATEARTHFGAVMREACEKEYTVIVERDGEPQVVVISVAQYRRLCQPGPDQAGDPVEELIRLGEEIRASRQGAPLPDFAEVLHEEREERDEHLASLY